MKETQRSSRGGVDFRAPFDDDGHSVSDGPLQRFFRMRKWFFATAVLLVLLETSWVAYDDIVNALKIPLLPREVVHSALSVTGIYLLAQGALVVLQIIVFYGDNERARKALVNADQLRQLDAEIDRYKARGSDEDDEVQHLQYLQESKQELLSQGGWRRWIVTNTERVLDIMRIGPTYLFLLYAVAVHGYVHVGFF